MGSKAATKNIIGVCGILCSSCPAYIATQTCNNELKRDIVRKWSIHYNLQLKISDICCDGCQTPNGRLFRFCKECHIRSCHLLEGNKFCYKCHQFPCTKITDLTVIIPEGKIFIGN